MDIAQRKTQLERHNLDLLQIAARQLGVKGYSSLKKEALAQRLAEFEAEPANAGKTVETALATQTAPANQQSRRPRVDPLIKPNRLEDQPLNRWAERRQSRQDKTGPSSLTRRWWSLRDFALYAWDVVIWKILVAIVIIVAFIWFLWPAAVVPTYNWIKDEVIPVLDDARNWNNDDDTSDSDKETPPATTADETPVAPTSNSSASIVWGPAGPAPTTMEGAVPIMYPSTQTIMGWIVPHGTVQLPKGVCVDFDSRSTAVKGTFDTVIDNDAARRVRMTSNGQYEGAYPATVYWTPC